MSSPRPSESTGIDPAKPIQYRLRHALIAVTVSAIGLAGAAPFLRTLSVEQWQRIAASIGLAALGFTVGAALSR